MSSYKDSMPKENDTISNYKDSMTKYKDRIKTDKIWWAQVSKGTGQ